MAAIIRAVKKRFRGEKSPEQEIGEYLSHLQGSFPGEISSMLAAAMLAKKSLDATRQISVPFPEGYLDGSIAVDDAGREMLRVYVQDMQTLRGDMIRFNSLFSIAVAKGLGTWIVSLHALARPDLQPKGREIWSLLRRGEKGLQEAYKMLLRRKLSDADKACLSYRPAIFMTDEGAA